MLSVRPKIAELVYRLYGRALHPELFQICATQRIEPGQFDARVDITNSGHVVTFNWQGLCLTEVATSAHQPLPQQRCFLSLRLKGEHRETVDCFGGIRYTIEHQLDRVDPKIFWTLQEQLAHDHERKGITYRFESSGRMSMGALSYIHVDTAPRSLFVQALHTFPDDYAVLKCQSRLVLPETEIAEEKK